MSGSRLPNVVRFVRETPWAILPSALEPILELVEVKAAGGDFTPEEIEARIGGRRPTGPRAVGSIAMIPIQGAIVPRANLMQEISGGTSLEVFTGSLMEAVADPAVSAIVLDVNSPGGSVAMVTETAARIRAARASKPIVAVANTMAASAAYHLIAQADEVVVTPSGMVGSIGVFIAHQEISGLEEKAGVKTTLISAGKHKVAGNEFEPLSEEGRADLQAIVDELYAMFVSDVARGRGVPVAQVREGYGEGRIVTAREALALGMVDAVETIDDAVARVARGNVKRRRRDRMSGDDARAVADFSAIEETLAPDPVSISDSDAAEVAEVFRQLRADMRERTEAAPAIATLRALADDMRRKEEVA